MQSGNAYLVLAHTRVLALSKAGDDATASEEGGLGQPQPSAQDLLSVHLVIGQAKLVDWHCE